MLIVHFPCNGQEVNEYFLEWKKEDDGKWLTLPHTKVGGNCASLSLGPLKYVLWVGGSINGVGLGFSRSRPRGWVFSCQPVGAQQRGLCDRDWGSGPGPHVFLLEEEGWFGRERARDLGSEYMGLSKANALARGDLASFVVPFSL